MFLMIFSNQPNALRHQCYRTAFEISFNDILNSFDLQMGAFLVGYKVRRGRLNPELRCSIPVDCCHAKMGHARRSVVLHFRDQLLMLNDCFSYEVSNNAIHFIMSGAFPDSSRTRTCDLSGQFPGLNNLSHPPLRNELTRSISVSLWT